MAFQRVMPGIDKDKRICKIAYGQVTCSRSKDTYVEIGFKPSKVALLQYSGSGSTFAIGVYSDIFSSSSFRGFYTSSASAGKLAMPNTAANYVGNIKSIDDNGFTINNYTATQVSLDCYYFAIE